MAPGKTAKRQDFPCCKPTIYWVGISLCEVRGGRVDLFISHDSPCSCLNAVRHNGEHPSNRPVNADKIRPV